MYFIRCAIFFLVCFFSSHLWADLSKQLFEAAHNSWGWPSLHYALYNQQSEAADWLLNKYPELALASTPPIKLVASTDFLEKTDHDFVLDYEEGISALELALMTKNLSATLKILQQPVDINHPRRVGEGCFEDQWIDGHYTTIKERIKRVNVYDFRQRNDPRFNYQIFTPLYWAIQFQELEVVEALMQQRVALNHVYLLAEEWRDPRLGLFSRGARITKDLNAIDAAVLWGNRQIVKKLLCYQLQLAGQLLPSETDLPEAIVDLVYQHSNNQEGHSALFQALYANDLEGFELLLDYGFDPSVQDRAHRSLFDIALEQANHLFVHLLISKFPERLYLMEAIKQGREDLVQELVKSNVQDKHALLEALKLGKDQIAILLLPHVAADEEAVSAIIQKDHLLLFENLEALGWPLPDSLLSQTVRAHAGKIAAHLLDKGCPVTAEHYFLCVTEGELEILQQIIKLHGISSELKEELTLTALEKGRDKIFTYLLED